MGAVENPVCISSGEILVSKLMVGAISDTVKEVKVKAYSLKSTERYCIIFLSKSRRLAYKSVVMKR